MVFSKDELERYTRHFVLQDVGVAGQKKIKAGSVLVVGAGGLGSPVLLYLAAAGVGKIGIIDGDQVDCSNLQRQVIHSTSRIGENKARSAEQTIHALNPNVEVIVYENMFRPEIAQELVAQYDIVVDGVDNFAGKFLINDACVLEKKPFVHGGILGWKGQVFTYIPDKTCCYRCIYEEIPKGESIPNCSQAGVIGALPGIIGSMQALEVLRCLLALEPLYAGKMYIFNGMTGNSRVVPFPTPAKHCKVCGPKAQIHSVVENQKNYDMAQGVKGRNTNACARK